MRAAGEHGSRTVNTCTECKQAKLKCDSKAKYPGSCSRCHTRGLVCTVDATFKRVPARQRLSALTKEVNELRNQQLQHPPPVLAESEPATDNDDAAAVRQASLDDFTFDKLIALEGVSVTAATVVKSFQIFAEMFRPQFPIIDCLSIDALYQTKPVLFWTILIIVIAHVPNQDFTGLFHLLRGPYTKMLEGQILRPPLPLHKIQALLLLCHWPLPVEKQPHDPSWLYCGVATQAGRMMSLGRLGASGQNGAGLSSSDVANRAIVWLGCFYTSSSLALHSGIPPSVNYELDLPSLQTLLHRRTVPKLFAQKVKAMLIAARYVPLMTQAPESGANSSIVRLVEADLDAIKSDATLDPRDLRSVELAVLEVKMLFYALVVISRTTQNASDQEVTLQKGLNAALRVIHLSTSEFYETQPETPEYTTLIQRQRCLPKNHYRTLAFATIFILKFSHHATSESHHLARHIQMSQDLFKACSFERLDEYDRTAKLLEVLEKDVPRQEQLRPLSTTHRMGFSIVLDAIKKASEVRGKPIRNDEDDTADDASPSVQDGTIWVEGSMQGATAEAIASFQADWTSDFSWGFWGNTFFGGAPSYEHDSGGGDQPECS